MLKSIIYNSRILLENKKSSIRKLITLTLINYFIVIYLNNILIYFKLKKDYYIYIGIIIKRLRKYKLYIKLSKYFFNINKIEFLRFIISFIKVNQTLIKSLLLRSSLN